MIFVPILAFLLLYLVLLLVALYVYTVHTYGSIELYYLLYTSLETTHKPNKRFFLCLTVSVCREFCNHLIPYYIRVCIAYYTFIYLTHIHTYLHYEYLLACSCNSNSVYVFLFFWHERNKCSMCLLAFANISKFVDARVIYESKLTGQYYQYTQCIAMHVCHGMCTYMYLYLWVQWVWFFFSILFSYRYTRPQLHARRT